MTRGCRGGSQRRRLAGRITGSTRWNLPAQHWWSIRPACCTGRTSACSRSPTCISRRPPASRARRAAAALRHRGDAGAACARRSCATGPRTVIALGDSFHDGDGPQRLGGTDRDTIASAAGGARLDLDRRQPRSGSRGRDRRGVYAGTSRSACSRSGTSRQATGRRDRRPSASDGAGRRARPFGQPHASPATASAW